MCKLDKVRFIFTTTIKILRLLNRMLGKKNRFISFSRIRNKNFKEILILSRIRKFRNKFFRKGSQKKEKGLLRSIKSRFRKKKNNKCS